MNDIRIGFRTGDSYWSSSGCTYPLGRMVLAENDLILKCRVLGEVRFSKKVIASFQVKRSVFTKCICVNRNDGGCPSWIRIYCFNTDKVLAMLNNWLKDECSDCVR